MLLSKTFLLVLVRRRLRVVLGQRIADLLDRFFSDTRNVLKILRRKIRQLFDRAYACSFQLLNQAGREAGHGFKWSGNRLLQLLHLTFDFSAFFFFALDVDAPTDQLRCKAHILPLFTNGERELAVLDHHFHDFFGGIDNRHAADLGGADRIRRKGDDVVIPLNDVDLLSTQFANDGLYPRPLHANAGAHGVDVLLSRGYGDLRPFAGFARSAFDLNGTVINFRHFGL